MNRIPSTILLRRSLTTSSSTTTNPSVKLGLLLKRTPVILATPTPLETAYYSYRESKSLNESRSFAKEFFYKKGSLGEQKWNEFEDIRREGSGEKSFRDVELENVAFAPKITEADTVNDTKSLDRKLDSSLFLIVKNAKKQWRLPTSELMGEELLHEAAERFTSKQLACRKNGLETWLVGKKPVGVEGVSSDKKKTFFMKSHVIAGQVSSSVGEYQWVTKEEMKDLVVGKDDAEGVAYWEAIEGMM